jgi:lipoprotein-releasing system permease protein
MWNTQDRISARAGTRTVVAISVGAIALSMAVMIIALGIITGFREEIRNKVSGFGAHVQVTAFNFENPLYSSPLPASLPFASEVKNLSEVKHVQTYALKEGIIKSEEEMQGVLTKGVGPDFDWAFFERNLIAGSPLNTSDSLRSKGIVISKSLSGMLKKSLGDEVYVYYVQEGQSRPRKFVIEGIYETGMSMMDDNYILADIRHVQHLNGWADSLVSGYEILLHDYTHLDRAAYALYKHIPPEYNTVTLKQQYPEIFGWLELQDMNIIVILLLMTAVAAINIISALLILILDKTAMIGLLKAMGAADSSLRRTFLIMGAWLTALGLLGGNAVGLGLGLIQKYTHFVSLPQEAYYMPFVPFELPWAYLFGLNLAAFFICTAVLLLPVQIISNISPVKALRFE